MIAKLSNGPTPKNGMPHPCPYPQDPHIIEEPSQEARLRFETPPGEQAQVDFARFEVEFTDEPGVRRIVWLFSMVLGYSRLIWVRFALHQDLQSVLRCHIVAFAAIGGAPRAILYDRMKTALYDRMKTTPRGQAPSSWRLSMFHVIIYDNTRFSAPISATSS
jgi:transposase